MFQQSLSRYRFGYSGRTAMMHTSDPERIDGILSQELRLMLAGHCVTAWPETGRNGDEFQIITVRDAQTGRVVRAYEYVEYATEDECVLCRNVGHGPEVPCRP